jgi:uncharacterized delta-60 repeat protein
MKFKSKLNKRNVNQKRSLLMGFFGLFLIIGAIVFVSSNWHILAQKTEVSADSNMSPLFNGEQILSPQSDGDVDTSFVGGVGKAEGFENITTQLMQPDGKQIIAGEFTVVEGIGRNQIARLNIDGSLDTSFDAGGGFNNRIESLALQPDGKIIVVGRFGSILLNGGIISIVGIARLNTDGSLDLTFSPSPGSNSAVYSVAIQSDGKILIGGEFTTIDGISRRGIARYNSDGTIDPFFNPGTGISGQLQKVNQLQLQADGKIIIVGSFSTFNGISRNNIARLNANGSLDSSFNPGTGTNSEIRTGVFQSDGKVVIGGSFTFFNSQSKNYIARLNLDGSLDSTFTSNADALVKYVSILSDGKFYVSGDFSLYNGVVVGSLIRILTTGSLDTSFVISRPSAYKSRRHIVEANGSILSVGERAIPTSATVLTDIIRFNPAGEEDLFYNPIVGKRGLVRAIKLQPDGKVVVGGDFNIANNQPRLNIARFNQNGTLDTSFAPRLGAIGGQGSRVSALALQTDGKIIVGGEFRSVNGVERISIARLNSNGTIDLSFNSQIGVAGDIYSIAIQANGKILIVGRISSYNGVSILNIVRVNTDGSFDTTFNAGNIVGGGGLTSEIYNVAIQGDGKILICGYFIETFNGNNRRGIARLNSDGSSDTTFNPGTGVDYLIYGASPLSNGKILIYGQFSTYNTVQAKNIARINQDGSLDPTFSNSAQPSQAGNSGVNDLIVQTDGKLIISGGFETVANQTRRGIARLTSNGELDTAFINGSYGANSVGGQTLAYESSSGKAYYGAGFTAFNNIGRGSLVRLFTNTSISQIAQKFDFDGDRKTDISIYRPTLGQWWYLRSSDNTNRAFSFGTSTDKIVPADYTGDGKTDIAVFNPSTGFWSIMRSEDSTFYGFPFGANGDIAAPADYDGDGKADAAVFRTSNSTWFISKSSGGTTIQQFGASGDKPTVADYDGDGKADLAIYRVALGQWWRINSSDGSNRAFQFGTATDKPMQGDYTGDGKADLAFFRPTTGQWFILRSEDSTFYGFPFGTNGDIPASGDYDGDGKFDPAVFRPSNATWYLNRSTSGVAIVGFGANGDQPVPNAFVP